MNIVSTQLSNLLPLPPGPAAPEVRTLPLPAVTTDSVAMLLNDIAAPHLVALLQQIAQPSADAALLGAAVKAVQEQNFPLALAKVREMLAHAPGIAESLAAERAFAPIRTEVETLVRQLKSTARADAEQQVALIRSLDAPLANRPETLGVLQLAERLIETDRYGYTLVAAQICRPLVEPRPIATRGAPPQPPAVWPMELSVLIILWLAAGLLAGLCALILRALEFELWTTAIPFELWGAGSAGIIGFGTYRRLLRAKPALALAPDRDN